MSFTSTQRAPAIRDPRAMRALAHPARLAILERLSTIGPATATECAASAGLSPSACSYHLRALSRWGLVEETAGDDRRERRYRVLGPFVLGDHDGPRAAEVAAAEHLLTAEVIDRATKRVLTWLDGMDDEPREWRDASMISNRAIAVTASELDDINRRIDELLAPYARSGRTDAPAGARTVMVHLSVVPSST